MGPKLVNCCRPEREWSTGSSTSSGEEDKRDAEIEELRAQNELLQKNSGGAEQGRQGFPLEKESGFEEEWSMGVGDENENRKKFDEERKKLQKDLRKVEKLSCVPKEDRYRLKNDLQQRLLGVEQRRHDIVPDHQKVQKRSQKTQSIQDKRRNMQKENAAAQGEMRKIREENDRNEERFRQLSDKVVRQKWWMQKWRHSYRACRQGKKEEAVMRRRQVIAAWRWPMCQQFIALNRIETFVQRLQREI